MIVRSEMLKKAVHADRVYYLDRIVELDIEVLSNMELLAVGQDWVEIKPEGRVRRTLHDIDNVIFCTGYVSRKAETDGLRRARHSRALCRRRRRSAKILPGHRGGDAGGAQDRLTVDSCWNRDFYD